MLGKFLLNTVETYRVSTVSDVEELHEMFKTDGRYEVASFSYTTKYDKKEDVEYLPGLNPITKILSTMPKTKSAIIKNRYKLMPIVIVKTIKCHNIEKSNKLKTLYTKKADGVRLIPNTAP